MITDILLQEQLAAVGIRKEISWKPEKAPHVIICGATGSGKTYFSKLLLGKISVCEPTAQIYLCDFKGDEDFSFLYGCQHFYRYTDCATGLQDYYERFQARQRGEDKARNMLLLFFDEWAAYCNSFDKKAVEEEKRKLSNLLMLGRSFRVHVMISQQRADAVYFNAARDNFNLVVGLGNLSEESKSMLFHEYKQQMKPDRRQGTGYILENGAALTPVLVPTIHKWDKLHQAIKRAVK